MAETRTAVFGSRAGLHSRPAARIVAAAKASSSLITISRGDSSAEGSSILSLLSLGASYGDELSIVAVGDEAAADVERMATLLTGELDD